MSPTEVGRSYDTITAQWESPVSQLSGICQHKRAMQFLENKRYALDLGCGCNGRFIDYLKTEGFQIEGVDVSAKMIDLAKKRDPDLAFHHADICRWQLVRQYDFITAWDSIWHVQLVQQEFVLRKLCNGLNKGGVFIFTLGGTDGPTEVYDSHMGVPMYTATLGISKTLDILSSCSFQCRHLEYDQHPELHVYAIAQKT